MARRRDYAIVIVILAIGWTFWLQRMGVNDHDDMLSNELIFARGDVMSLLFRNPWPDQSPLYFLFLHVVRAIGESAFAIQLVNAVLLTMTLVATYMFGLAFSRSRAVAGAAIFWGAVSPTSLWLVRNGRMYSLQILFSVIASLFVLRYLDRRRPRDLVVLTLISVLNIYSHFVGFLITVLLFVPLIVSASLEAFRLKSEASVNAWDPLRPLALAAIGVAVLAFPQIVRFASLVGQGVQAARADISLPPLSSQFLGRIGWFWFVNADWGSLGRAGQVVTAVYVGSIVALAVGGLTAVGRRVGLAAALWILFPLVGIGLTAARMDVRDRYFVWTLPLLWIAVATGGFGAMPSRRITGAAAEIARGVRAALVIAIAAGSLWLLWNKLPERYAEWTKLMEGLEEIYRPSMRVYMPPGSSPGTPRLLARQLNLPAGLQDIRDLSADTHAQFLTEVDRGQDFVFLLYATYDNAEMQWRIRYLEERNYQKTVLPVFAASAQIFTRGDVDGFWQDQRLAPNPSPETIVAWARSQLHDRSRGSGGAVSLADAVVARVHPDGVVRKGRLFISQHGEDGSWKLGPQEWDGVQDARTSSGRVERKVIAAHPATGSVLVVALPALKMKKSLELWYGIADTGLMFRSGADVNVSFYVSGEKKFDVSCPNTPGWKVLAADTASLEGRATDVVMLITTANDTARHFAFRLEPSSQPAMRSLSAARGSGPVELGGGRTLADAADRLRVYRLEGERRIDAQSDGRTYSAAEMHEATGSGGEGSVRRVWALGPFLWDSVGVTRQTSGGDALDGLWAHPRTGTTLVVEAPAVKMGALLRGYLGFTDFSVDQAQGVGVRAPVSFKLSIDNRPAFESDVARTAGWTRLAIPIGGTPREHSLRIEISCAIDSWAHFIFDLSSD
jgi:hypothetical protein